MPTDRHRTIACAALDDATLQAMLETQPQLVDAACSNSYLNDTQWRLLWERAEATGRRQLVRQPLNDVRRKLAGADGDITVLAALAWQLNERQFRKMRSRHSTADQRRLDRARLLDRPLPEIGRRSVPLRIAAEHLPLSDLDHHSMPWRDQDEFSRTVGDHLNRTLGNDTERWAVFLPLVLEYYGTLGELTDAVAQITS